MNNDMSGSILSQIQALYERSPDRVILTFVDDAGRDQEKLTVRQLAEAATAIAQLLDARGLAAGDRAILCYMPSLDFVKAFVGCLMAGVVPVAVYPPNLRKLGADMPRFEAILTNSGARAVLTHNEYERAKTLTTISGFFRKNKTQWPDVPWLRTDRAASNGAPSWTWRAPVRPDDPAFLQYTSGSTGTPKGVIVTHRNLVEELRSVRTTCDLTPDSHAVIWAPQYHDMGLIILLCGAVGSIDLHVMSPLAFLKRPATWFEVMSRTRATHTAAPNFALDLAVKKTTAAQRAGWDLNRMRTLICAAEPIRLSTVQAFFAVFSISGLKESAFQAGYGLAEHTLTISFFHGVKYRMLDKMALEKNSVVFRDEPAANENEGAIACFNCGAPSKEGGRVRIVDPETCEPCAPGRIGEIWADSSTKAGGYYGLDEESRNTFRARVKNDTDTTEYLRTGDLGFLHEGELYVTGRCKDLMIIGGRNLYPQDIEDSIRGCHPLIRPGGLAAFAVTDETVGGSNERLVVFIELQGEPPESEQMDSLLRAIRHRVFETHQLYCYAIVVGSAGTVKKTTSGKVRRSACRQAFLSGEIHREKSTIKVDMRRQQPVVPHVEGVA